MEQQRGEPLDSRIERGFPVRFPEEPRIAQPRRDDPLRIPRDRALVVRFGVDDGEKRVLQSAVFGLDRKVVLMVNQRGRQHFLGKLEELVRERPRHDRRVLDEVGHLVQQAGVAVARPRLTRPCSRCAFMSSSRAILS